MIYTKLGHYSHPEHKLKLIHSHTPYKCDGCMDIGFGLRYRCKPCNFDLHKDCMFATSSANHAFYKDSVFKFHDSPPGERDRFCDACGGDVKGFVYHCEAHNRDLHPCCRNLPCRIEGDGVVLNLKEKVTSKCYWCGKRELWEGVTGWSYVSTCKTYHFHVSCVKDILVKRWEKEYFNGDGNYSSVSGGALEIDRNPDLELVPYQGGGGGRFVKYLKMVKFVVKLIVSTLLGDPTAIVASIIEAII
ncbi:hypothetical protein Scep_003217 [Stephania cephalantha]|uniref:Phorbol-ester/DAG-type domain-containing protein n=1 Tax=Stephania cephalantha TaxID=152367 RepID=A0AAP0KQ33_9MAGN